ncbi:MAG TPA: peptide chain release factor N(5)-glutamine methyltransferase [Pleomorphomonadaceae bacterium]|nr:peptide chain release factor N(5)-glutamine methyltransferase [Pleomorphomonadaceae bacterium]
MSPAESPTRLSTAGSALVSAVERLREAGSPTPRLDAEILVAHALERDRAWLLAHLDEPMPARAKANFAGWIERRAGGEPIAYIRGFKEWYGLRLATDRRSLIPRPETELLADAAIGDIADRMARDDRPILAWEVGTGGGAVAVVLARRFRSALALGRLRLVASDVSPDAIDLAAENLATHGLNQLVTLAVSDLLDPLGSIPEPPDVVVANLPYLRSSEVETGLGSLGWEPAAALDGGPDGLAVIRRLLDRVPRRLAADGSVLLEIGEDQAGSIRTLAAALPGAWSVSTLRDLAGNERIIRLERLP